MFCTSTAKLNWGQQCKLQKSGFVIEFEAILASCLTVAVMTYETTLVYINTLYVYIDMFDHRYYKLSCV